MHTGAPVCVTWASCITCTTQGCHNATLQAAPSLHGRSCRLQAAGAKVDYYQALRFKPHLPMEPRELDCCRLRRGGPLAGSGRPENPSREPCKKLKHHFSGTVEQFCLAWHMLHWQHWQPTTHVVHAARQVHVTQGCKTGGT